MNRRPSGYEPDELPNCSTPRYCSLKYRDYYSTESSCCQEEISNFCAISRKNAICSTCNRIHACFFRTRCATLIAFFKMHSQSVRLKHLIQIMDYILRSLQANAEPKKSLLEFRRIQMNTLIIAGLRVDQALVMTQRNCKITFSAAQNRSTVLSSVSRPKEITPP